MSAPESSDVTNGGGIHCRTCGVHNPQGANFCSFCGNPLMASDRFAEPKITVFHSFTTAFRNIMVFSLIPLAILLAVNVMILAGGISFVIPETLDPAHGGVLFLVLPLSNPIVPFFELNGLVFAAYYLLLVIAIAASFALMVWRGLPTFKAELGGIWNGKERSQLYVVGTIFFALLAFQRLYYAAIGSIGITASTPEFESEELWALLYGFASASVWEELIIHVLLIGMPLFLVNYLVLGQRDNPKKYLLGGNIEIGQKEIILIIISASLFGFAHVVNWDIYKILPSLVAGIGFGYLFLKIGLYASICLHFAFNYLTITYSYTNNLLVGLVLSLLILAWTIFGSVYMISYARSALRSTLKASKRTKKIVN